MELLTTQNHILLYTNNIFEQKEITAQRQPIEKIVTLNKS